MKTLRIVLQARTLVKLRVAAKGCRDADTRVRYRVVLLSAQGWSGKKIATALGCATSTVSRTLSRWQAFGEAGLIDRREDNGSAKADGLYVQTVQWILRDKPSWFGHHRPTWTKSLLIETARRFTGVSVSSTTMGRVLKRIRARRGRAKPLAPCPWSEPRKNQRIKLIRALIDTLPSDQACVWEDEADIDLNPRIGVDWTLPGQQRTVMTPGKNVKRYFAAAMDARSDQLTWVKSAKKNSSLFIDLLKKLLARYEHRRLIHLVLDNYVIHSSRQTKLWLQQHGQRLRLHFLPPYDPDDNRIERKVWREVHANVTINHERQSIDELCLDVTHYLMQHNRRAERLGVRETRSAI